MATRTLLLLSISLLGCSAESAADESASGGKANGGGANGGSAGNASSSGGSAESGGAPTAGTGNAASGGMQDTSGSSGTGGSAASGGASGGASAGSGGTSVESGGSGGAFMGDCAVPETAGNPIKIACVGDSITFGYEADPDQSYPSQLGVLLGAGYSVQNDGISATTMLKNGNYSYWTYGKLSDAEAFLPDVVVLAFGSNDMTSGSSAHLSEFTADYVDMIELFQNLDSHPVVFAAYPPWIKDDDPGIELTNERLETEIIPRIDDAASQTGACIVDFQAVTEGHPEYYVDKLHPNATGYGILANAACKAIVGGDCPG